MKHLLSIQSLTPAEITEILRLAAQLKKDRVMGVVRQLLQGQCWGLIFAKASTRTRVSFEVGIRELGGQAIFFSTQEMQLGRGEPIKDTARVLGRMLNGAIIRTFDQPDVEEFAAYSGIPTINALTDDEHPCQILADLQTIQEHFGSIQGRRVCFLGDGACNVARSWIWAAHHLDLSLTIGAPAAFQPAKEVLSGVTSGKVEIFDNAEAAVEGADVLYTDVWVSMGREAESAVRLEQLKPFQLNHTLYKAAAPHAIVMHCLPAYRDKEITSALFEEHAHTIFTQAENRLHTQKAILETLNSSRYTVPRP